MKYTRDDKELKELFEAVIAEHFPILENFRFVYTWRDTPKYDDDNALIIASVHKLPNQQRDIFEVDIRVEVDEENWLEVKEDEKYQIAFHELLHIRPELIDPKDEDSGIKEDKHERAMLNLIPHDIVIKRFKDELLKFGLGVDLKKVRLFLNKVYRKHKRK